MYMLENGFHAANKTEIKIKTKIHNIKTMEEGAGTLDYLGYSNGGGCAQRGWGC